jgi:SAM-dependent methyltransferase
MDFMNVANSFPVAYELVELTEDVGPYRRGATWAEPSVEDAARLMRLVRDEPELARSRAVHAGRDIERHYSEASRGQAIQTRLAQATAKLKQRRSAAVRPAAGARSTALEPPTVPPMDLGGSTHGRLGVIAKRGMNFLLRYHTHYQGELNIAFAKFMRQLQSELESQATAHRDELALLQSRLASTQESLANARRDLARIDGYFAARPYMSHDAYGTAGELSRPMGYGFNGHELPGVPEFAELFRGAEEFIADRQRVYLRFFRGAANVLDLGSGRGEFLQLLCENGINAVGVEIDEKLVECCRARGLRVELADAYEYLEGVPEGSLDVIFSAQFVEHVDPGRLPELLELARTRLRGRGLFIAETVNPESHLALKSFYVDLSHQRPIFPQVLLHMCQTVGYTNARIFYPTAGGFTQTGYRDAGEYAVVATK